MKRKYGKKLSAVAVVSSDWHLRDSTPVSRKEEDWMNLQFWYVRQIIALCRVHDLRLVIAGDIFDRWKVSPELVNRTIRELRVLRDPPLTVPGQHDLPFHRYEDMHRSSYGTLVASGAVTELVPTIPARSGDFVYHGFPWSYPVQPLTSGWKKQHPNLKHVAVVHDYIWHGEHKYPGAPEDKYAGSHLKNLTGYAVAVYGDNHRGFDYHPSRLDKPTVFNCGTLIRQKADERSYKPRVGLLHADGSVTEHYLDCSGDQWVDKVEELEQAATLRPEEFLEMLSNLGEVTLDFAEAVRRFMDKIKLPPAVRKVITECLEGQ